LTNPFPYFYIHQDFIYCWACSRPDKSWNSARWT